MKVKWFGWLIMVILLVGCESYQFKGTEYSEGVSASDFTLTDSEGRPFQLSERQGEIALLFWGYTACPTVCPATLTEIKRVIQELGDDAEQVTFLFITVDPERDTPALLAEYTAKFHPDIIGLTGTPDELKAVRNAYGIYAAKVSFQDSAAGYLIDHTTRVFLVDGDDRIRLNYAYGAPASDIVPDIRYLLQ